MGAFCVLGLALCARACSRPWSAAALLLSFLASGVSLLIRRSYPGVLAGRGVLAAASSAAAAGGAPAARGASLCAACEA